jgi:hypothetical protein
MKDRVPRASKRRETGRPATPAHSVLRLQATAGNRAVSRMLSRRTVQRMKIGGVKYDRGDTVRFAADYLAATKRKLDAAEIRARFGTDERGFNVLFNVLATGTADFVDLDEFIKEMNIVRRDWTAQKLFYQKPKSLTEKLGDVEGQEAAPAITLYSARGSEKVQRLLWWAFQNNIPVEGFDEEGEFDLLKLRQEKITAPFKGHFGDRSHTVKHMRQKGGRLISIVLNASGSKALRDLMKNPENITKSEEGYERGAFGLKSEEDFVSVGLGISSDTWDYMKGKILKIRLHPADETGPVDVPTVELETKGRRGAPARIEGVGRIVNVSGSGMNCLIRAIYRALNVDVDDAQVGIVRSELVRRSVTQEGRPLDLANAAGATLISFLVQQGLIAANRGIEVYSPGLQHPHVIVNGVQPIRLWLSGGHFQAIVPG